ncbi:hypothetical protein BJV85_002739 [Clostridium acetobutylicum]|jgi:uncharacterized protein YsxB (DUF464 family)|uniref:Ribosomal processing cysteine protease Prp n=1 Tax=Clostridium acetobutylicum (strain ATCC 824 / DSM 792 / JCM 1419 / IAM 19013 / LMG 5710 / NBRC 13948 / NRRL B-527 / VKM B-1787 / 2291 / W) TaxID=272562 RepID=Q97JL6_CLOAB|nr:MULTISPECIES: ribosomal-processing cysteine protease Prp [Clostridium]AAK79229.1 Hypothetical protein CA_C1258 [Clostridium acetobutylicum ATCC 824]ADZ20309.1 Conserved hypothetical protein [Clostridium acetobutylicum EA 2018]AEI31740.1 hypothetical protein SMB_G1279 [Clostridium acetobutylicum DSM 1731]AWV81521.1 ribosomal-processing cysteine protease Prp [Clostridium acetobutylicum]KHD35131.1 hypothetical protein NL50_14635 [Clostridium acetobutylicum]
MIDVVFKKKNNVVVSYVITGHADRMAKDSERHLENYDEETDMLYDNAVCSAVSLLGQVCILGIEEVLHIKVNYSAKEGYIALNLENLDLNDLERAQVLMKTTLLGFENLAESYDEYIKVSVEEV